MKTFTIEVEGGSAILGISPESVISISLADGKVYSAPIEKLHTTLARWHAKEHPCPQPETRTLLSKLKMGMNQQTTGKRRRRLFTSHEEMRKFRKEHPDQFI